MQDIKERLGHRFSRMRAECMSSGLAFDTSELAILDYIGDDYMEARYLVTGTLGLPQINVFFASYRIHAPKYSVMSLRKNGASML